ncbi:MAG: Nucleotidyltransferase domain protein [Candidatus Methanoperedenaceae archaeon GB37]|uniref:Nucleotidyltransferase domain-containing protein n=1 Tax=Desulfofervidus auxilii TaxID=1621989 RepID=A0A7V1I492_DESA2|nr:Nucleotidyltransferase domain protein [Candidatus Methanoperedenaceae archaeon GB37]CAD7783794.1 MAG: Nucleotidyltransferase domain protein [Candidatus Methanoperedenaceae archaeon GB37]HEB74174.1 nucleotidyltransferase domain-containing protein [Candidatus Desulfofervidus auxilii]
MKQPKEYLPSVRIRFLDRGKILRELKELSLTLKKERQDVISIILFGSLAKGNYTGGSDADIIIIVKHSQKDLVERIFEFRKYFLNCSIPVDVLVYTEEEIKKMQHEGFIDSVMKEGVNLTCL